MTEVKSAQQLDCSNLTAGQINNEIKRLASESAKSILLKNTKNINELLCNLSLNIKIEILDSVNNDFANTIQNLKLIINGNVGDNSAAATLNSKITVFGSCGNHFAHKIKSSEIYILENCSSNSFYNLSSDSKLVLGGLPGKFFADNNLGGKIIILNLKGGNIFIEENWFNNSVNECIYLRGGIKNLNNKFNLVETNDTDEDVYLPLISEFSRLFKVSLSEIKSKQFYRLIRVT